MMKNKALCHFAIARKMQKEMVFKNSHKMECNKVKMDFTGGIDSTLTMLLSFEQKKFLFCFCMRKFWTLTLESL